MGRKGCIVLFSFMMFLAIIFTAAGVYVTNLLPLSGTGESARETLYILGSVFSFLIVVASLIGAVVFLCLMFSDGCRRYY